MSIPRTELHDEVLANLELSSTNTARYKVYEHLNQAQFEIASTFRADELETILNDLLIDLVSGVNSFSWPDGTLYTAAPIFLRFYELMLDYNQSITSTNSGRIATVYDRTKNTFDIAEFGTLAYPYVDLNRKDGFLFSPVPIQNVTSGMRLMYIRKPAAISASVDSELNYKFKNLVIYRATALSCLVENYRPSMHKDMMALWDKERAPFIGKIAEKNANDAA